MQHTLPNRSIIASITTTEMKALNGFLSRFIGKEQANEDGVILVKSIALFRLGQSIKQQEAFPAHTCIPITTSIGVKTNVTGIFSFLHSHRDSTIDWVSQEAASPNKIGLEAMQNLLANGDEFRAQHIDLRARLRGLRQTLQINTFPLGSTDATFMTACEAMGQTDLCSSHINISTAGAVMPLRMSLAFATSIYFHHKGAKRHWIVVSPQSRAKLEEKIKFYLLHPGEDLECTQWLRHKLLWITPEKLKEWRIQHVSFTQQPNEFIFIFPGAYYFGFSEGLSIVETKLYGGKQWSGEGYIPCIGSSIACDFDNWTEPFGIGPLRKRKRQPSKQERKRNIDDTESPQASARTQRRRENSRSVLYAPSTIDETSNDVPDHFDPITVEEASNIIPNPPDGIGVTLRQQTPVGPSRYSKSPLTESARQASSMPQPQDGCSSNPALLSTFSGFELSDDEEEFQESTPNSTTRLLQLEQANAALLRDLTIMRGERDSLKTRKATYKARLLEREALILSLEQELAEANEASNMAVHESKLAGKLEVLENLIRDSEEKREELKGLLTR